MANKTLEELKSDYQAESRNLNRLQEKATDPTFKKIYDRKVAVLKDLESQISKAESLISKSGDLAKFTSGTEASVTQKIKDAAKVLEGAAASHPKVMQYVAKGLKALPIVGAALTLDNVSAAIPAAEATEAGPKKGTVDYDIENPNSAESQEQWNALRERRNIAGNEEYKNQEELLAERKNNMENWAKTQNSERLNFEKTLPSYERAYRQQLIDKDKYEKLKEKYAPKKSIDDFGVISGQDENEAALANGGPTKEQNIAKVNTQLDKGRLQLALEKGIINKATFDKMQESEKPKFKAMGIFQHEDDEYKNGGLHKQGGFVKGSEEQYTGDTIPARLNKDELVLNLRQQQQLIDRLNGEQTVYNESNKRVDEQVKDKDVEINKQAQQHLFQFINGQKQEPPKKDVVQPKYADGEGPALEPQVQTGFNPLDEVLNAGVQSKPELPMTDSNQAPVPIAGGLVTPELAQPEAAPKPEVAQPKVAPQPQPEPQPTLNPEQVQAIQAEQVGHEVVKKAAETKVETLNALHTAEKAQKQYDAAKLVDDYNAQKSIEDAQNFVKQMDEQAAAKMNDNTSTLGKWWNSAGTVEKIGGVIALAISLPFSVETGKNPILDYMSNSVDKQLAQEKLSTEQRLSARQHVLIAINSKLNVQKLQLENSPLTPANQEKYSNIKLQQATIASMVQQMQQKRIEFAQGQQMRKYQLGEMKAGRLLPTKLQGKDQQDLADKMRESYYKAEKESGVRENLTYLNASLKAISRPITGVDDIGAMESHIKSWDPAAAVREGKVAVTESARPLWDNIINIVEQVKHGRKFTDELRKDLLQSMADIAQARIDDLQTIRNQRAEAAEKNGIPPEEVVGSSMNLHIPNLQQALGGQKQAYIQGMMKQGVSQSNAEAAYNRRFNK